MSLNSQKKSPATADKVKYLFLADANPGAPETSFSPYFYAEAKVDFNDVRTGFRETISLSKAMEIYSNNADLLWSEDMIQDVDVRKIMLSAPDKAQFRDVPDFVSAGFISKMETQFTQYLLRSYSIKIYRNFDLNVYSLSGESRSEFIVRCRDLCEGPKRLEMDQLHDVSNRMLEQIKQRYMDVRESVGLEQSKTVSQNKDVFSHYSERIAALFLRYDSKSNFSAGPLHPPPGMQDLEERLLSVELEAQKTIAKLLDSYAEKAGNIDEYILHPNLKDIHFVRSCILWMPQKAN
jgi:hypothetical protein